LIVHKGAYPLKRADLLEETAGQPRAPRLL
jgi:hypothetical protein